MSTVDAPDHDEWIIFRGLSIRMLLIGPALLLSPFLPAVRPYRWTAIAMAVALLVALGGFLTLQLSGPAWHGPHRRPVRSHRARSPHGGRAGPHRVGVPVPGGRPIRGGVSCHRRCDQPALRLLDLDHFQLYNDRHGHPAGDQLLRSFAEVVGAELRHPDVVVRWGGEEFCLLIHGSPDDVEVIIERLRSAWTAHGSGVTFSAGIGAAGADDTNMLDRADTARYEAKAAGRNRTILDP